MTTPAIPQLPNVSLGNTATDISSAVSSFAKGLQAERIRRREEAMKEALLSLQMMRLNQPDWQRVVEKTPTGLEHTFVDPMSGRTQRTGLAANDPQYFYATQGGTLAGVGRSGINPPAVAGGPAQDPNLAPRDVAPMVVTAETEQGPVQTRVPRRGGAATPVLGPTGQPVMAPAQEPDERRARDAFEMVQAKFETSRPLVANPRAYQEAANYLASLGVADKVPVVGGVIKSLIQASQSALSPEASAYFSAFMHLAAARAFSRGGATLTQNEIDYSLLSLRPAPGESGDVSAMRDRLFNGVVFGAIQGNPAWQRFAQTAKLFGFDLDQLQAGQGLVPPVVQPTNINPLTGRPRRH